MLTWMDRYTSGYLAPLGYQGAKMLDKDVRTDLQAARLIIHEMVDDPKFDKHTKQLMVDEPARVSLFHGLNIMKQLKPFICAEELKVSPLCIHVDNKLETELWDAEAPENDKYFYDLLQKHRAIYIDFDMTNAIVGEQSFKAITINNLDGDIRLMLVGDYTEVAPDKDLCIPFDWNGKIDLPTINEEYRKEFQDHFTSILPGLKAYIKVLISYYLLGEGPKWTTIPHVKDKDMAALKNEKKRKNKLRKFSMFRVLRADFSKVPQETRESNREGHKLTTRHTVRDFWRNQPYGPGRSLRKKILIESFERGPKDGDKKLDLHKIESKWEEGK